VSGSKAGTELPRWEERGLSSIMRTCKLLLNSYLLFWRGGILGGLACLLLGSVASLQGQGTSGFTIYQALRTGQGQTLSSATQTFNLGALATPGQLQLAFFFATEEKPLPGQFLDAATITLEDGGQTVALVCLTVDANGVAWAPVTPGTIFLDVSSLLTAPLSYQDTSQPWKYQTAYSVTVPLPAQLNSGTARLTLDLFDNGDSLNSLSWISAVPEPGSWALLIVAGVIWGVRCRRRN
jgi:hypothetical protein